MTVADRPTIGIRDMHVDQETTSLADSLGQILVLDVHVEGIEVKFYDFRAHFLHKAEALIHVVDEKALNVSALLNM